MRRLHPPSRLLAACLSMFAAIAAPAAAQTAMPPARADAAIRSTLDDMNRVLAKRDVDGFLALFDDRDDIALVGSDTGEVFKGRAGVAGFLRMLYRMPFTFAFDLASVSIHSEPSSAWVFVEGAMLHAKADGSATRVPYRFSIAMVKRGDAWKWQLFHGAIPRGE